MKSQKVSPQTLLRLGIPLVLIISFQNCAKSSFDVITPSASVSVMSSADVVDDASLSIPLPADSSNVSPSPSNTQTTVVTTTGNGGYCPAFGNVGPSTSININTGNGTNQQSNNFNMKSQDPRPSVTRCATIDMADVKIMLEQLMVKQGDSEVSLGSLAGQFLSRGNSIRFVASNSVSDIERVSLVLQKSGHQFLTSKSLLKSMALKDANKKRLSVGLSQRSSFEKGRTYIMHLKVTEASTLVEDGSQCLLKPVLEVQ